MLRTIGCLTLLVITAVGAWLTRDTWMDKLRSMRDSERGAPAAAQTWQTLTPEGAKRAQTALETLSAPRGPAYAYVAPGDLAAYIVQELSQTLPSTADSIEAAAIGDRLYVRAILRVDDIGGKALLGPLGALLGDRERLQLGGTLRIIRPGFGELQVKEVKLRDFPLPQPIIPRLIREISRGDRPPELSPEGLPLKTPDYIGDVRVSDGRITIYRAAAP